MISIKANVTGGSAIEDVARDVVNLASKTNVVVDFEFNGIDLYAHPFDSPKDIVDSYMQKIKDYSKSKERQSSLSGLIVTAGISQDDKYCLTIQKYNGEPCLCVHKCDKSSGLHYSTMDDNSLVTAINMDKLRWVIKEYESRKNSTFA